VRRPTRARPGVWSGDLQMAPLIDAVFLLLTYFLFTISLSTIEGLLPSRLALGDEFREEKLKMDDQQREIVIRIVRTGERVQYFVNDWPAFDFASVKSHLASLTANDIVVIDAGQTVAYEHVVRLYNHCLQIGIEQVVFPLAASTAAAPRL